MTRLTSAFAFLIVAALSPLLSTAWAQPKTKMTIGTGVDPSLAQFYVAKEAGFFDAQNLDVTIKHASGQGEHFTLLAGKQIQVTTETATDYVKHVANDGLVTCLSVSVRPLVND